MVNLTPISQTGFNKLKEELTELEAMHPSLVIPESPTQRVGAAPVTGFDEVVDWFAMPGLYLSGMDAKETCETIKKALHAEFKSDKLLTSQMKHHLFEDPRVLWGIEGATPNSGKLPFKKQEADLVKGGMAEWENQVMAWINGGMKCE